MLIQPYQPNWVQDFNNIKSVLTAALLNSAITVEHVGSTAVKGLAAKSTIDIDIVYPETVDFIAIKNSLVQIGYYHNGDQGIYEREVFKRDPTTSNHPILDIITHHLYVCPKHGEELKRHLMFRDYLRTHAETKEEYAQLKYRIAEQTNQDRKAYAKLKETLAKPFIEAVIQKAREQVFSS
ncbi:MAG: GrpB family protein [Saprospiraceae bacterium]